MAKEEKEKYNSYQYDSVARAYAQPLEPVKIPVTGNPRRKHKAAPAPKVDIAFGVQVTLCGMVLFACSMIYIHSYSSLRARQNELNTLKTQKIAIANQITNVQAQMTKKLDLETIKKRAEKELGMQKPYAYQVVYLDLPEDSYTTYHESK